MENRPKNTILIVDDEPMCVKFLVAILENEYTLFVAKNGTDAINMAMNCIPDLIVLDVNMPDLSGYVVISALKHMDETKNIPVIFNTSQDTPEDKKMGLNLGAVDYLPKNGSPSHVKNMIRIQIDTINNARIKSN